MEVKHLMILSLGSFVLMIANIWVQFVISRKLKEIIKERYPELSDLTEERLVLTPTKCYLDARVHRLDDSDINKLLWYQKLMMYFNGIGTLSIFFYMDQCVRCYISIAAIVWIGIYKYQEAKKRELLELVFDKFPNLYMDTLKSYAYSTKNKRIPLPTGLKETGDANVKKLLKTTKLLDILLLVAVFGYMILFFCVNK